MVWLPLKSLPHVPAEAPLQNFSLVSTLVPLPFSLYAVSGIPFLKSSTLPCAHPQGLYHFLEAGPLFSWFGLVRLNWLFTARVCSHCLGAPVWWGKFQVLPQCFQASWDAEAL